MDDKDTGTAITVIDEKGVELGDCKAPDQNGKLFAYVLKGKGDCEANTGRFKEYCINYSLCDPKSCCF